MAWPRAVLAASSNITSSAVKAPIDILGLSNGARSGLTGFIAGLARSELAAKGMTMNNLLPGKFDTDRLQATFVGGAAKTGKPRGLSASQQALAPAQRFGTAAEFGAFVRFVQPAGWYVNGQHLGRWWFVPGTFLGPHREGCEEAACACVCWV